LIGGECTILLESDQCKTQKVKAGRSEWRKEEIFTGYLLQLCRQENCAEETEWRRNDGKVVLRE